MSKVYLDNCATTPVWPEVVKVMKEVMLEDYGNPSSLHAKGEKARELMDESRAKLAEEIGAKAEEVIFTGSATEANNWALRSIMAHSDKKKMIVSSVEHPAVSEVADYFEEEGYEVVRLKVDGEGFIDFKQLESEIGNDTAIVSVIHGNNVFGTIQDIGKIGELCRRKGVVFHTDAVQTFGKEEIDVKKMNIDLLSASGHKIGGPKGIGILYVRDGIDIGTWLLGGGQERNLRSGTENVPGIVGFAKALEMQKKVHKKRITKLRDKMIKRLEKIGGKVNGAKDDKRLYNNIHVSFKGIKADNLIYFLSKKGIYVSAGSACDSKKKDEEDRVLEALGLGQDEIEGTLRISLGHETKSGSTRRAVRKIRRGLKKLKYKGEAIEAERKKEEGEKEDKSEMKEDEDKKEMKPKKSHGEDEDKKDEKGGSGEDKSNHNTIDDGGKVMNHVKIKKIFEKDNVEGKKGKVMVEKKKEKKEENNMKAQENPAEEDESEEDESEKDSSKNEKRKKEKKKVKKAKKKVKEKKAKKKEVKDKSPKKSKSTKKGKKTSTKKKVKKS